MVTLNKIGIKDNNNQLEIYGLSTDTKPIDMIDGYEIVNGSIFIEMDTGKVYLFNKASDTWGEI